MQRLVQYPDLGIAALDLIRDFAIGDHVAPARRDEIQRFLVDDVAAKPGIQRHIFGWLGIEPLGKHGPEIVGKVYAAPALPWAYAWVQFLQAPDTPFPGGNEAAWNAEPPEYIDPGENDIARLILGGLLTQVSMARWSAQGSGARTAVFLRVLDTPEPVPLPLSGMNTESIPRVEGLDAPSPFLQMVEEIVVTGAAGARGMLERFTMMTHTQFTDRWPRETGATPPIFTSAHSPRSVTATTNPFGDRRLVSLDDDILCIEGFPNVRVVYDTDETYVVGAVAFETRIEWRDNKQTLVIKPVTPSAEEVTIVVGPKRDGSRSVIDLRDDTIQTLQGFPKGIFYVTTAAALSGNMPVPPESLPEPRRSQLNIVRGPVTEPTDLSVTAKFTAPQITADVDLLNVYAMGNAEAHVVYCSGMLATTTMPSRAQGYEPKISGHARDHVTHFGFDSNTHVTTDKSGADGVFLGDEGLTSR